MTDRLIKETEIQRKRIANILLHSNEIMEQHGYLFCLKLAETLIEKSVAMPCSVGDTIYQTDTNGEKVYKSTIKNIIYDTENIAFDERAIGTSIFLTEETIKDKQNKLMEKQGQ